MTIWKYQLTILTLVFVIVWLAWKYLSLYGQVMTGGFVSWQAVALRNDIKWASEGVKTSKDSRAMTDREMILHDLDWYLDYYDHHTNELARSRILGFVRIERDYVIRDATAYLRKTGTNDFGDDPYAWLRHEYKY